MIVYHTKNSRRSRFEDLEELLREVNKHSITSRFCYNEDPAPKMQTNNNT